MTNSKFCWLAVFALTASVAGCDCSTQLIATGHTVLVINDPMSMQVFQSTDSITFTATGTNPLGLKSLTLEGGPSDTALTNAPCLATGSTTTTLPCTTTFSIAEKASLISMGSITLTAVALDGHGLKTTKSVTVRVSPITCNFTEPTITAGTILPVANVTGTSALQVEVKSALPIATIQITYDSTNAILVQWRNSPAPTTAPDLWGNMTAWEMTMGGGEHKLTCTAADTMGNIDTSTLEINIACVQDSDCASEPNTRCCPMDGLCHPTVGTNMDCNCQNPCVSADGCVTGTCDQTPAKCRPGCFPGSFATNLPADNCPPQDGQPAYCNPLPASQVTNENKGGACSVGDACDVVTQMCAPQPVDRTNPAGPNNPPVPQTCTPAAPTTNVCFPAGNIPLWGINCQQTCGADVSADCVQGAICVTQVDGQGNDIAPPECRQQCKMPTTGGGIPTPDPECPSDRPYCEGAYGPGMVYYSSGVCVEGPCVSDADCAALTTTPCCNSSNVCSVIINGACM